MSKKKEIDKSFLSKLNLLIQDKSAKKIQNLICNFHIADIAEIMKLLPIEDSNYLFQLINHDKSALILLEIEEDLREDILSSLSSKEIANTVIANLESDDATDIISTLSIKKKKAVLSFIKDDQANDIEELLNYSENSAGGLMATELIKVNENWSTMMCLKEMRKQAGNVKQVHTIYVVNNDDILLGSLSLKRLLLTETRVSIKEIAHHDIISVKSTEDSESVSNIMNKYDLIVLPVTNEKGKLLGRITIDDVMDIVKEEAEKDYQMASGISESVESSNSIWQLTRARLPWLLIGLSGGLLGAFIIDEFLPQNNETLKLAFFIPLIAAMGGNVGVQSSAIVVQGLANNTIKINSMLNKLIKELWVSLINGCICSLIIFISTLFLYSDYKLSITVSLSLFCVIVFAALFGTFIPLILNKYKIDPALATGPFITTANDIIGLVIYFSIGQQIIC